MKDEAAYQPHHTLPAASHLQSSVLGRSRRLSEVGAREGWRELRKLKEAPVDES